jgi:MinD superfamily P-loop ATPase
LIKLLGKDYKVIVNRSSLLGFRDEFLKELQNESIEILGDIPLDQDIVNSYCQGTPLMEKNDEFDKNGPGFIAFIKIYDNIKKWLKINGKSINGV